MFLLNYYTRHSLWLANSAVLIVRHLYAYKKLVINLGYCKAWNESVGKIIYLLKQNSMVI